MIFYLIIIIFFRSENLSLLAKQKITLSRFGTLMKPHHLTFFSSLNDLGLYTISVTYMKNERRLVRSLMGL